MIISKNTQMCDATACNTGGAGTYLLGSQIDLSLVSSDIGNGEPVYAVGVVNTGITTAGSAGTVQFKLVTDAAAAIATDGSATEHFATAALVTGSTAIAAGTTLFCVALPLGTYERYLGVLQTTGTTALNAGKIDVFLTKDPSKWIATPDGL